MKTAPYASLAARTLAFIIDVVVSLLWIPLVLGSLASLSASLEQLVTNAVSALLLLFPLFLLGVFYPAWFTSRFGGTIGKLLLGLRVVDEHHRQLAFKPAFFREVFAKPISIVTLGLGLWLAKNHPKRQGWHDELAGTYVVTTRTTQLALQLLSVALALVILGGLAYWAYQSLMGSVVLQDLWLISGEATRGF